MIFNYLYWNSRVHVDQWVSWFRENLWVEKPVIERTTQVKIILGNPKGFGSFSLYNPNLRGTGKSHESRVSLGETHEEKSNHSHTGIIKIRSLICFNLNIMFWCKFYTITAFEWNRHKNESRVEFFYEYIIMSCRNGSHFFLYLSHDIV